MKKNRKIFLGLLLLILNSSVFAQKVSLIKEFRLEDKIEKAFGEPLIESTSIIKNVYDFLNEVPTENGLSPVNPGFFVDDKYFGFAVNYKELQIYIYNFQKNEWCKYFVHPDIKYKFILLELLNNKGCYFTAYNSETNERESLYFSLKKNTYVVLEDKEELDKKRQNMRTAMNKNQKLSFVMIHEEDDEILDACIESYYWKQSGAMGKCAVTDKKRDLFSFWEIGYEGNYEKNFFHLLKDLNNKDILVSEYYPPVFSSDFTKLLCITNLSYNPDKITEDYFTVYIYDIQY